MRQILFIILLFPVSLFGQTVNILVSDFQTNEPLPFANIYFKNAGIGASTNLKGYASFKTSDLLAKDSIVVSYVGYNRLTRLYAKENEKSSIEIQLKVSTELLSEVVVEYVKPPKPKKIIKTAIKSIEKNYSNKDVIYQSLYRETISENGDYIQLNEAIVKTYYTGYPQKNLDRKIWEDWHYDESYAFELEGNKFFNPLLKDFNTKKDQQIVIASRHSDKLSKYGIETTLVGDPLLLFAFDKIKYQYDFFNQAILNKYQFNHEGSKIIKGETCYVISFHPKSTDGNFRIDQSRKNKSPIYIGRIYISKESFALLKFQYKLAVERDFGFFEKRIPLDYQVEMNYKKQDDFYSIENIKVSETKKVGSSESGESILHTANKELSVISLDTENVQPFMDSTHFKSTRFSSIRYYKDHYNPNYWKETDLKDELQLGKKLVADLEVYKPLSEQFESYQSEQKKDLPVPKVFKQHYAFDYHDTQVIDSLHWMAFAENETKLKRYLTEENKFADNELIEDKVYQKKLFDQLNTFYPNRTNNTQTIRPDSFLFEEDSLSNNILYYQKDSIERIEVLNLTLFEKEHKNIFIKQFISNQSKSLIIVRYEKTGVLGDYAVTLPFGESIEIDSIANVYTIQWYSDSTFIYSKTDNLGSARDLYFHDIRNGTDSLIYSESDPKFDVEVIKANGHLFCTVQSKTENEIYLIKSDAKVPVLELVKRRKKGVYVDVKTTDKIFLLVNDEQDGSLVESCTFEDPKQQTLIANSSDNDYILDMLPMNNQVVALVYDKSIPKLKYLDREEKEWHDLAFKLGIGDFRFISAENSTNSFLFSFSSPANPYTRYRYNFDNAQLDVVSKSSTVNPVYHQYTFSKRLWAKGHDGTKIPITLVKNRAARKENSVGLILKVYGAYGAITTPAFDAQDAILLEQGYTIAYAHVRGESILGKKWYQSGREFDKENSILDYISCAEYLIKKGYTTSKLLIGYGNSAGGLVLGQAVNLKPELFNSIVLNHPYLDVINTMMNDALPLTKDEYKEWGNPQNKEVYDYILRYSPYQNIKPQQYPNVLLIASFQDYQTPIWQVAKYLAKLRANNQSNSEILMITDMSSGHIGNTTGKEWIKLFAKTYSFTKLHNQ